jgi:hypothetical protein
MDIDEGNSVWNLDAAQFWTVYQLKKDFVMALREWDLENAYWSVRLLRMELDAKLKRKETHKLLAQLDEEQAKEGKKSMLTEKQEVDKGMEFVDREHLTYSKLNNPSNEEIARFFAVLETFYMDLCHRMKKHGMYYREGDDSRLAVLRR